MITRPKLSEDWVQEIGHGIIFLFIRFAAGGIDSIEATLTPANAIPHSPCGPSSSLLRLDSCRAKPLSHFVKLFNAALIATFLNPLLPAHGIPTQEIIHNAVEI